MLMQSYSAAINGMQHGDCRTTGILGKNCRPRQKQTLSSSFWFISSITHSDIWEKTYSNGLHCWYRSREQVHRAWFALAAQCWRAEGYIATHNSSPTITKLKQINSTVGDEIRTMKTHRVVPRSGNHHRGIGLFWSVHREGGNFLWWVGEGNVLLLGAFLCKTRHGLWVTKAEKMSKLSSPSERGSNREWLKG